MHHTISMLGNIFFTTDKTRRDDRPSPHKKTPWAPYYSSQSLVPARSPTVVDLKAFVLVVAVASIALVSSFPAAVVVIAPVASSPVVALIAPAALIVPAASCDCSPPPAVVAIVPPAFAFAAVAAGAFAVGAFSAPPPPSVAAAALRTFVVLPSHC